MILAEPTYFQNIVPFERRLSFLKSTQEVATVDDATTVVVNYLEFFHGDLEYIKNWLKIGKKVIIDSTYELLWEPILTKLLDLGSLHGVEYYSISRSDYALESIKKCQNLGLKIASSQYFADYGHYYVPIKEIDNVERKAYILYTGKTRPERTLLVALMSYESLLNHGYVSYFGDHYNEYAKDEKIYKVYEINEVRTNPSLRDKIQLGISKLNIPLTIYVNTLSWVTAHSKIFNADYYLASDFAIVCETQCDDGFFITEKTIKCILLDKKFIVYSSRNYVKNLKKYYIGKFNKDISHLTDWCNLSYDDEPDKCRRAVLIVEEVKKAILDKI